MSWLMILGAGASMAAPTRIPAFESMRDAILHELGWSKTDHRSSIYEHRDLVRGRMLPPLRSARLSARAAPPEVVFGTLHRFGIPFAPQVERALREWTPGGNALHRVAAEALHRGWPVWTPNVDVEIEKAHREIAGRPPARLVVGERDADDKRQPVDFSMVTASTLVKFHGSVDLPGSLAFTDLELLAPYTDEEIQRLSALARSRRVVVYGYAGADTDLRDLIASAFGQTDEVRWYEPSVASRDNIRRVFDGLPIWFDPDPLPAGDFGACIEATANAFLAAADAHGLLKSSPSVMREELPRARRPFDMQFDFDPPAIVHARLIERFGRTEDEDIALSIARRADLLRGRPRAIRQHARWAVSRSLYRDGGILHRVVGNTARRPKAIPFLPKRLAAYVYDKGPAVLLPAGEYEAMHHLVQRALEESGRDDPLRKGSDLYYLAHGLRYMNQPARAADALTSAARLLVDRRGRTDTERYAGVLLERGIIAIYQGRINDAFVAADELVRGPGRYAIGRWSGWGHWLSAMAHLYITAIPEEDVDIESAVSEAMRLADRAANDFDDSSLGRAAGDIYVVRLLGRRLRMAAGHDEPEPVEPPRLARRQSQDVLLLRADTALVTGDLAAADRCLQTVERSPTNDVTKAWARLGRTEVQRRTGAGPTVYDEIEHDAESRGAWWLAAQAALGRTAEPEITLSAVPSGLAVRAVGDPRVLWLLT